MRHPIVVGLQYGDEGKGKITDILAQQTDWVIRFNGGSNAGHTIWLNGKKIVTHSVPSGVLYPQAKNYIGAGCVVEPVALRKELDEIKQAAGELKPDRLQIDYRAHLTLPIHLALDGAREATQQKIGTTKRGIGPTYVTKMDRLGIRVGDLLTGVAADKMRVLCKTYNALLRDAGVPESSLNDNLAALETAAGWMKPYIATEPTPFYSVAKSKRCVLEGAQGILLDSDHGVYPFVTSSNTLAGHAVSGAPFPLSKMGAVIGIAKAYVTRVGEGILPTELNDATGDRIRKNGHEFGATTGRPRRCGWLNLDELRQAVQLTDCTYIVLTKADVLAGEPTVQALAQGKLHPFSGWDSMYADSGKTKLHANFETFARFIEQQVGVPVVAVGTGTDRADLVWRHDRPDFWKD
ncbi:MAG: adenylosuccinate synthetase [Bdellovibrionales bacterium]|nr:adenylosuccinate synthetase [Bdellovibrionales bacterium]